MKTEELTIGRLAKSAEVNVETVRYYQRIGLLDEPAKPSEGFRHYSSEVIDQIRFIKRAQRLGFSLKEIRELLALGYGHCNDVRALAEEKRTRVQIQINDLLAMRKALDSLIDACHHTGTHADCALIEALSKSDSPR